MKQFSTYFEEATFPVINFRRSNRFKDGQKTEWLDSIYTTLQNYEQIDVRVPDDGKMVTQDQVKSAADAGKPLEMSFHDLEIIVKGKSAWEIQAFATASKATMVSNK